MGQTISSLTISYDQNPVNYFCVECRKTGKTPNIAGRFFLINETQCKCNGCNNIFDAKILYTSVDPDLV